MGYSDSNCNSHADNDTRAAFHFASNVNVWVTSVQNECKKE